jgi:hAT family C-terminal dimerisation region
MYQALCHYFPIPPSEKLLSALLDPRCKKLDDFDHSTYLDVKNKLCELYKEKKILENERKEKQNQNQENDEYSNTVVNLLYTPSLLKSLDKEEVAQNEMEEYLDLAQIGLNNNPLEWWKSHSVKFPILSEISKIYLAVPATSTPSERLFSDAGNLLTSKRTRMLPELFKRMIFLKKNISKFESIHPTF